MAFKNDLASKNKFRPKLLYNHTTRKTTVKPQVIRLMKEGWEFTRNNQEVYVELIRRFREAFSEKT